MIHIFLTADNYMKVEMILAVKLSGCLFDAVSMTSNDKDNTKFS